MIEKKIDKNLSIFEFSSNYDYTNSNNLDKINVNSDNYFKNIPNNSIVVIKDFQLGGYISFLESIKSYNKKYNAGLKPVVALNVKEDNGEVKTYYAKNQEDLEKLLSINNYFIEQDTLNLSNLETELNENNYMLFNNENNYQLKETTGLFSPKYSGRFDSLLKEDNNFSNMRNYLNEKLVQKLNINTEENPDYLKRINEELDVLCGGNFMKQNFLDYMLVVSDIVSTAKENDIRVGPGRGSGAGSLVAYLLDITEVNPIEFDLSFERFLNKDRPSFPDFDLDFDSSKLNILKSLINEKLNYSIIQIGTLNSHSHNDFLSKINNLSFLNEEEKVKIRYDIKNDFDIPELKEKILKNGEEYLNEKFSKFNFNIDSITSDINKEINFKLNNLPYFVENKDSNISALKILSNNEYYSKLKELSNENQNFKKILNLIGSEKLGFNDDNNKTALYRIAHLKANLVSLFKEGKANLEELKDFDEKLQTKLFNGSINGRFLDFLVQNIDKIDKDFDYNLLQDMVTESTYLDLGQFNLYFEDMIKNPKNILEIHNQYLSKSNENNKVFYNNIYNFINSKIETRKINQKNLEDLFKSVNEIKTKNVRILQKNLTICEEFTGDKGLVSAFIKNFETFKGLGAHASGHIIVSNDQFKEMLKVFPVLQQEDKKNSRDPVMGVNHKYVEQFGGVKFDLLGLKTLTIYEIAKNLSNEKLKPEFLERGHPVCEKMIDFFSQDRDLSFIFQAEGVEIKTALNIVGKELKNNKEMKLVDAISNVIALARPGPIENGTLYDYLSGGKKTVENFNDKQISGNGILNIRDKISDSLKGTNGYLIYQEQVIEVAKIMGLSGGEADNFRRAISKKNLELLSEQKDLFIKKGLDLCGEKTEGNKKYLESVFDNLASFAEYGFNKSHSICYANLCCEGAFYAVEHPNEFITSLFNTYGGEVGVLDNKENMKEVLKSNDKIEPLIAFAGSLNVPVTSYWDSNNINKLDINKDTDKEYKVMTHINNGSVVLSSKILNSKNQENIDLKSAWAKGNMIGKGEIVDVSNLKWTNQANYMLKNEKENGKYEIKAIASYLNSLGSNKVELTASIDNDKKYTMFLSKDVKSPKLTKNTPVTVNLCLTKNSETGRVFASVNSIKEISKEELHSIYDKNNKKEINNDLDKLETKKSIFNKNAINGLLEQI